MAVALIWLCVAVAISLCVLTVGLLVYRRYVTHPPLGYFISLLHRFEPFLCTKIKITKYSSWVISNTEVSEVLIARAVYLLEHGQTQRHMYAVIDATYHTTASVRNYDTDVPNVPNVF